MVTVKSKVVATLKIRKNKTTKINKEYSGSCGDVGARRRPVTGAAATLPKVILLPIISPTYVLKMAVCPSFLAVTSG